MISQSCSKTVFGYETGHYLNWYNCHNKWDSVNQNRLPRYVMQKLIQKNSLLTGFKARPPMPEPQMDIPAASERLRRKYWAGIIMAGWKLMAPPIPYINPCVKYNCQNSVVKLAQIKLNGARIYIPKMKWVNKATNSNILIRKKGSLTVPTCIVPRYPIFWIIRGRTSPSMLIMPDCIDPMKETSNAVRSGKATVR